VNKRASKTTKIIAMLVFWSKTEICSAMYNFFSAKNFTSPFTVKYLLTNFIVTLEQGIIIVQNKTGFISAAAPPDGGRIRQNETYIGARYLALSLDVDCSS